MSFVDRDPVSLEAVKRKLESSGIPTQGIKELHLKLASSLDFRKDFNDCLAPKYATKSADGFLIPYFNPDGTLQQFARMRQLAEPLPLDKRGKPIRYRQPTDTNPSIYLPPVNDCDWSAIMQDSNIPVCITEGELKSASVCYNTDYPCIGLGGVWMWRSAKHRVPLLPSLEAFRWQGRDVYIVYDSDAEDNIDVRRAEAALAKILAMRGANVFICRLPPMEGGGKCGADDFIVNYGGASWPSVIEKAEPYNGNESLYAINDCAVYCRNPSMVVVLRQDGQDIFQEMGTRVFEHERFSNLRHVVMEETADGRIKSKEVSSARAWMEWPGRLEVNGVAFEPGKERFLDVSRPAAPNYRKLNAWNSWGAEPQAGSLGPWQRLLDHIFGADTVAREYFLRWAAFPLQNPGAKMYAATLLWSVRHGTGKSWLAKMIRELYGEHGRLVADDKLFASFNYWAHRAQFVVIDEIAKQLDYGKTSERLKRLITQDRLTVHLKYLPEIEYRDCVNYFFTSNDPDCIRLEDGDRRFFIHEVLAESLPQWQVEELKEWWDEGTGREALMHHLRNEVDCTGFTENTRPPLTAAKENMIEISKSDLDLWVRQLCEDPDACLQFDGRPVRHALWSVQDLLRFFDPDKRFENRYSQSSMASALQRAGFRKANEGRPVRTMDGLKRLWVIRDSERISPLDHAALAEEYQKERGIKAAVKAAKFGTGGR